MGLIDRVRDFFVKNRLIRSSKPPLAATLSAQTVREAPVSHGTANPLGIEVPPGIDFAALWEDPADPSRAATILAGIAVAIGVLTLLVVIFKH